MPLLTNKKATSRTRQIVTIILDDSDSMRDLAEGDKSKATVATESIKNMIMAMQGRSQGSKTSRYLVNLAKFGDKVTPIAVAKPPKDIDLEEVVFYGNSGWTNMALALDWGAEALEEALKVCRSETTYDESQAPPPLVVFISDGERTAGPEPGESAARLRGIPFKDGEVSVIACGIAMKPEHFKVMKEIASSGEAVNIKPSRLAEFIAAVAATARDREKDHFRTFRNDPEVVLHEPKRVNEDVIPPVPPHKEEEPVVPPKPLPEPIIKKDEWDSLMVAGRAALQEGRHAEAERAFLGALNQVHNAADSRRASTLICLVTFYTSQEDWEKATQFATEALDLMLQLGQSTTQSEGLEAAEKLAELLTVAEKQTDADNLWMRIVQIENKRGATLPRRTGELAALGFHHKAGSRRDEAIQAFEQAVQSGGVGAAAALKGLIAIAKEREDRAAAERFLEQLKDEMERRYGPGHALTKKVRAQLRLSYVLSGKKEKVAQLDQKR